MPPVSQAQRRWAFANRDKKSAEGRAAKEFADADPGGKLPERSSAKTGVNALSPKSDADRMKTRYGAKKKPK